MNKKGFIPLQCLLILSAMGLITIIGVSDNVKTGQGKKNAQSIWAHMSNKCGSGSTDSRCIMK